MLGTWSDVVGPRELRFGASLPKGTFVGCGMWEFVIFCGFFIVVILWFCHMEWDGVASSAMIWGVCNV